MELADITQEMPALFVQKISERRKPMTKMQYISEALTEKSGGQLHYQVALSD